MRVRFWGVRGGVAATEAEFQGTGGNTPCIEVRDAEDELLILDAGIGLYWLGRSLLTGPHGRGKGRATLLLSHTHWDHIQGFPFFVPGFIPGNDVSVYGGGVPELEDVLEGQMNPTYSPLVSLSNMGASVKVGDLAEHPDLRVGRMTVTHRTFHNGPHEIVGYRIEEDGRSLAYVCEAEHPEGGVTEAILELARGADVLIHEAYYTGDELAKGGEGVGLAGPHAPPASGHSSYAQATEVALRAGVNRLYYFYHHPDHSDSLIGELVAREQARLREAGSALEVDAAREGVEFEV